MDPKPPGALTLAPQFCCCATGLYHRGRPAAAELQTALLPSWHFGMSHTNSSYTPDETLGEAQSGSNVHFMTSFDVNIWTTFRPSVLIIPYP